MHHIPHVRIIARGSLTLMRIIKKYPNRRLYDTETSAYITLTEVKTLVLEQAEFQVVDAKSGQDITRSILMQIILEEECGAAPLFSSGMLSQMIRSYGNAMQGVMGSYLEKSFQSFLEVQHKLQDQARTLFGETPKMNADSWVQFLQAQNPSLQGLMGSYLKQSANVFLEMQTKMQQQTRDMLGAFSFVPPAEGSAARPEVAGEAPPEPAGDTADPADRKPRPRSSRSA